MQPNPNIPGEPEDFIKTNINLAHKVAWKYYLHIKKDDRIKFDFEDIRGIAYIGLIKAYQKFNSNFGTKFSTYAVPMIQGEIRRQIRDFGYTFRNKRGYEPFRVLSMEKPIYEDDDKKIYLQDALGECDNYDQIIINEFLSTLPPYLRKLYHLRIIKEFSQAKTGKALGCSQVHVSRMEKELIELAKEYGREDLGEVI